MSGFVFDDFYFKGKFEKIGYLTKYLIVPNSFIAGGAFKDILSDKVPRDIDLYFYSKNDFNKAIEILKWSKEYVIAYSNDNVEAYKELSTGTILELVKAVYGSAYKIIGTFDFTVDKFAFVFESGDGKNKYTIVRSTEFFESMSIKNLNIEDDIKNPVATMARLLKYSRYGYKIEPQSLVNLLNELRELDDDKYEYYRDYVILGENDNYGQV